MKIVVQFVITRGIAAPGCLAHLLVNPLNVVQHLLSSRLRDPDSGELLEADQDFHGFANLGGSRIGHDSTDMRHQADQPLGLEGLQSLPQRRP